MEILIKDERKMGVNFGELESGDCFTTKGYLYMKIPLLYDDHKTAFNAVNIKTGNMCYFEDRESIQDITSLRIEIL